MNAETHTSQPDAALIMGDATPEQNANAWAADVWDTDSFIFDVNFGAETTDALH